MPKIFRRVQFAANIAILILTPLVTVTVVRQLVSDPTARQDVANVTSQNVPKRPVPKRPAEDLLGKPVPLAGVNWKENQKTLVLYLSTSCRYCNESVPFYQRLLKEKAAGSVKIVALFSQSEDEAKTYLDLHKIKVDRIMSDSLRSIGVTGTPTILLVNENGLISNFWRGKLNDEKEAEVVAKLAG